MTDRDIATWFRPTLTPADRDTLRGLVRRVDRALGALGLDYVIYSGSLLGHCIYRDFLPWDDDADLLVLTEIHPGALAERLAQALPGLGVVSQFPRLLKVSHPQPGRPWGFPFVDVGFMYRSCGEWCHESMWGGTDTYPAAIMTPTRRGFLGDAEVSVPHDPEAVCRKKYGPDCMISAVPPHHDHLTQQPTGFPQVRVPIERIDRVLRDPTAASAGSGSPAAQPHPVAADPRTCVVLVPSGKVADRAFEAALAELNRRGYPVRRLRQPESPPGFRDRMVADALAAGFAELLFLDPAVVFDPSEVERLRAHDLPFVCGVYPWPGRRGLVCEFQSGTISVGFGRSGGPIPVVSCGLGFALVRREVFEAVGKQTPPGTTPRYFATDQPKGGFAGRAAEEVAFCTRAREAGFEVVADTSIRLWRVGPARLGWEDAGGDRDRHDDYTLHLRTPTAIRQTEATSKEQPIATDPHPEPPRNPLHGPVTPLPEGFPRIRLYVVTYPANAESLAPTLASIRASDWGEEPTLITQPADWPKSRESGSRNYKRALEAAAADGCDFALVLEDDVRVNRHLRHNLLTNPLVARDQCDYLSLFMPDLVADPWERCEAHLGYRLARPRYTGSNRLWQRNRVWGAQAYLLSRRFVRAALDRWDRLREGQDSRVIGVCGVLRLPLWYTAPCLVEHAPLVSAFGTPAAHAPDFDPDFRLELGVGFQPPEEVPGWLTLPEGQLLAQTARGREVLELGTRCGRSTVCLAQSARRVVSVDIADQSEAAEWTRRYGVAAKVEFVRRDTAEVCRRLTGPFGLIFIDTLHDAVSVTRDITAALRLLEPGGLLAFHDYPNPGWPDVRMVVDEYARRLGWRRTAQADFLGVFATPG